MSYLSFLNLVWMSLSRSKRIKEWKERKWWLGASPWGRVQMRKAGKLHPALVPQHLSLPDHRASIPMIRDLWVSQESLLCIATSAYNALWDVLVSMKNKRHLVLCCAVYIRHGLEIWLISHLLMILTQRARWANPRARMPLPSQFHPS